MMWHITLHYGHRSVTRHFKTANELLAFIEHNDISSCEIWRD